MKEKLSKITDKLKKELSAFNKLAKKHSKIYFKTNVLFFAFVGSTLLNAIILRYFTVKNYVQIDPILADLAIILIIGSFGYFIKPKHQFKYFMTWSVIFTAICLINSIYYNNYSSFVSFSLLKTSVFVTSVADAVVSNIMEYKDLIFIWQIIAMIFINKSLKRRNYYEEVSKVEKGKVRAVNTLVVALIVLATFMTTLNATDISRLYKQWNREYLVTKYGVYLYQFDDLIVTAASGLNPLFGYDEAVKDFNEFYEEKEYKTEINQYTNIFEGKNVIAIHAESIQNYLLGLTINGEEVTPNLNKLTNTGLYFSNFYSQESVGTSSDSEFTFLTSLLPASSGTTFVNYYNRNYDTTLKQLKDKGYYTFSMHGNNGTFWNRINAYEYLGYDHYYYYTKDYEIDETIGLGLTDKSFFRQSTEILKEIDSENENFYGTVIMLSNHTPFTNNGEDISDFDVTMPYTYVDEITGETKEDVAPYLEGTTLGSYIKSVHYADEALGEFINGLDEAGILDNTVLVVYGDHDSKLKKSEYRRMYNYVPETDSLLDEEDPNYVDIDYYWYELNRSVPLIIWSKDNKVQGEVTEVMGMYDAAPTLANMLGFKLDYALGNDIFNVEDNVVIFPDGNWLTNDMYYSQSKQEGYLLDKNSTVSVDYIQTINEKVEQYLEVSNSIIVYDLIDHKEKKEELLIEETS